MSVVSHKGLASWQTVEPLLVMTQVQMGVLLGVPPTLLPSLLPGPGKA